MVNKNTISLIKQYSLSVEEFKELENILSNGTVFDYMKKYCSFNQNSRRIDINLPISDIRNKGKLLERHYYICNELLLRFKIEIIARFNKLYLEITELVMETKDIDFEKMSLMNPWGRMYKIKADLLFF